MAISKAIRASFTCKECGWRTAKWVGRCGQCHEWGSVLEDLAPSPARGGGKALVPAVPIGDVDATISAIRPTGVSELDRVLGGGLVPGAVILVAGEPGVGKSTLLLAAAAKIAAGNSRVLYISGEESAGQVRLRADRIGAIRDSLLLATHTDLDQVLGQIEQVNPDVLVLDSVQTVTSGQVEGSAGGVAQVREVAAALITVAKQRNMPALLVGHVTKDGTVAGPRTLEHLVDVVCQFEGDRHSVLRMVRAVKNRFGPTDEVGCFELNETGIVGLPDPSGLFLTHTGQFVPGSTVTVTLEGRRPLAVEVQALVSPSDLNHPRRATSGIDNSRLAMILAVLTTRCNIDVSKDDVYVSTVGGVRLTEPACDVAIALAVASAKVNVALPVGTVAIGEVGLAGEIRSVTGTARRLGEATRLGFRRGIVPVGSPSHAKLKRFEADTLAQAISVLG